MLDFCDRQTSKMWDEASYFSSVLLQNRWKSSKHGPYMSEEKSFFISRGVPIPLSKFVSQNPEILVLSSYEYVDRGLDIRVYSYLNIQVLYIYIYIMIFYKYIYIRRKKNQNRSLLGLSCGLKTSALSFVFHFLFRFWVLYWVSSWVPRQLSIFSICSLFHRARCRMYIIIQRRRLYSVCAY